MVIRRLRTRLLPPAAALSLLLGLGPAALARELTYLPRNEEVEMISSGGNVVLNEHYCDAAQQLIQRTQECQDCVLHKAKCPNCCLASPDEDRPYQALRCAGSDDPWGTDPDLNCKASYRFDSSCPQTTLSSSEQATLDDCSHPSAVPLAQRRGCPGLGPNTSADPIVPLFSGCGPYFNGFQGRYFDVQMSSQGKQAVPTKDYSGFVGVCRQDADSRESCAKRTKCCKPGVCGAGGYEANCVDMECKTRLQLWERPQRTVNTIDRGPRACWELSSADCLKLNEEAQNCLNDVAAGTCSGCFLKIYEDDSFKYRFVAKSAEKVVLLWKIYATSVGDASQSDYFYTKIQVEDSKGNLIYTSPVHQKVFQGSFGIFSAVAVPPDLMKTGEEYFARLYYFINVNRTLQLKMSVTGAEIVAIKVRE